MGWLLLGWLLLGWLLLGWLLLGWLLLEWLFLGWLLLGWLFLIFSLNKTPLGENGFLSHPYFLLTGSSGNQFFDSPSFPTQSVKLPLVTYPSLCSTCVTYRTLCHAIGHQVLPTQPLPREVEDFPRGDKYFKHVPPPAYLIYFSPKGVYVVGSIYVLRTPPGTLNCPSLVLNQHFKIPIC